MYFSPSNRASVRDCPDNGGTARRTNELILGWLDFIREGVLSEFGKQFKLFVYHRTHTVRYMLLMRPMNGYTLLAVPVITARPVA